jgi:molybdopterin converting factor small subunit
VADVADSLKLPRNELGIMLINSRHVKLERLLEDGDTLALFPLLGGG